MKQRKNILFSILSIGVILLVSSSMLNFSNSFASIEENNEQESLNSADRMNWRWTNLELISSESSDISESPKITADNLGNVHIVWADLTDYDSSGSDRDIFYKKWNSTTKTWNAAEIVSTVSSLDSREPSIDVDSSGNVYVVWRDLFNYDSSGADTDILLRIWDSSTESWNTTKVVSTESTADSIFPDIDVDSLGNAYISWVDDTNYNLCGSDGDIFYKKWLTNTQTFTTTEVVSVVSSGESSKPSIAADDQGFVYITWVDETFRIDSDKDLLFNKWDEDLSSWSGTELLNDYITLTYLYTDITLDLGGNIHIVSRANGVESTTENIYQLIYYKWDSGSQQWLTPLHINDERAGFITEPSIVSDSLCNIYVGWTHGGTNDYDIRFRYYDISTSSWSTEETISSPEMDKPRSLSLAVDGLGHIHAVWYNDFEYLSSGSDRDIFYRKFIGAPETTKLAPTYPSISELSSVNLYWDVSYGATSYYVYRSTQPIWSVETLTPIDSTTDTDYIDTLPSEDTFYYAVVASNFAGNSSVSNCELVTYVLPDPIPLQAPDLAIVVPNPSDISNIFLDWDDIDGATGYYIYRANSYIWSVDSLTPLTTVVDSDYIDALPSEDYYFYVIVATDGLTNSTLSNCEYVEYRLPTLFEYLFPIGLTISLACIVTFAIFLKRKSKN